jgi:glutamine amidotransferase
MVVVDYERGNLRSVQKALEHVGAKAVVTRDTHAVAKADKMILPGVGAFADCMENLKSFHLIEPIMEFLTTGRPFLGICLGLQLLFTESEEFGFTKGLNIIPGRVVRFPKGLKVPHMGWNAVEIWKKDCPLLKGIKEGSYFYFVHSYYVVPFDFSVVSTSTTYGVEYTPMVWKENIFATQFHPEKSQSLGLTILENFHRL